MSPSLANTATPAGASNNAAPRQTVAIIGLGYVGLPLAVEFANAGHVVLGLDVDERKINAINARESYIPDVAEADVARLCEAGLLSASTDFGRLAGVDAIIIAVPTPLRKTKDPDVSYIVAAAEEIAKCIRKGQTVVLESTTYPGTTEELLQPMFEANGLVVGQDFYLAFSPERVDPGNKQFATRNIPKIVGGVTPACTDKAVELYSGAVANVMPVSSARVAETAKLLENTFRSVNIALVNEMALMCHHLDVDVWEVIDAAATKPFGFMKHTPGPGIGGHCIPLDPFYLAWKARLSGFEAKFIGLAGEVNGRMPEHVVHLVSDGLNDDGKAVKGSRVMVLGMAYKRDVGDTRESPAIEIVQSLRAKGASVSYNDPYVGSVELDGWAATSTPATPETLAAQDVVLVVTDHSDYDWATILPHCELFVDTRNVSKGKESLAKRTVKL
ncbi:MAG TPA: nucleotide sugar dehydrogenase [Armatimonadota bacterium]|jgi:UDP-N-acetyl-D-glucosamine dehydrogenase